MATYAQQLAEVQAAISAVLKAQAYTFDNRSVTRADLRTLQEREQYLTGMANREARGGGIRRRTIVKHP